MSPQAATRTFSTLTTSSAAVVDDDEGALVVDDITSLVELLPVDRYAVCRIVSKERIEPLFEMMITSEM
jgi:hypothetical protein